ncbi:PAS domain S-box protein [Flavobacterium sp. PL12]|uniref:PAS domain S-box protein n=1 Tax=Flavobacterium sp. PL12 TaxID=3071718 RepID=UPI00319E0A11
MENNSKPESIDLGNIPKGSFVTIDTHGKITDINEASIKSVSFSAEDIVEHLDTSSPTDKKYLQKKWQHLFEKGFSKDYSLTINRKTGELNESSYNASIYEDANGITHGFFTNATDSSAQILAAQYSHSLIEASLDPLITIDSDGKITDMNEALVTVTGILRAELTGSNFFEYFTEKEQAKQVYKEIFTNNSIEDFPLTIKHIDGTNTDVLFNGSIYKNIEGIVQGVVVVARNISGQKWAVDLRIANAELAFQNIEKEKRAAELAIANKELIFQNQEKEKRAAELVMANQELAILNDEKEKRANELIIANTELVYQNQEKEKRAAELVLTNKKLILQSKEKEKWKSVNKELTELNHTANLDSQYTLSLIEASRDPLVTINTKGKITDMNEAFVNNTGYTREELTHSPFFTYFTEQDKASEVYQEIFDKGSVNDSPLTLRHRNGNLTDVLFNGSVYKNEEGNVAGVVVVARDITDQRRIANELIEARVFAELATEIAEVAKRKAENATITAENAVKAKQQFLSNMSHEIRTPMNAIIGFTKVVLKTELTPKQKEYLDAIKMSGDALIVLINDILDLAKVDSGKMTFEKTPFKLRSSVAAMLHLFEPKIQEKNLKLIKEYDRKIPGVLIGDSVRLHQIILNLVSNAVKFTAKGKITVSVHLLYEDEEKVIIEFAVADTGIGIPEDRLGKIFENFQQASSHTSRLYGGTGLGLAIVKQLIEPQGGTIRVKSEVGQGSTFSFTLNFQKTTTETELESENIELDKEIKNIKVLVVEDIPLNQLLMKTLLDDFGFERDVADNGKIAIEKLQVNEYDVILMDLQMPIMNGFETTEYIRKTMNSKIPIIALTADVTTVDLAKCKAVGMTDYLAKPVDERLLYNKIIAVLKKSKLNKKNSDKLVDKEANTEQSKCINLTYLKQRTKLNKALMAEMISLYLSQTPELIATIKRSLANENWLLLSAATHKIIPSFAIVGIDSNYEQIAKKIQYLATSTVKTEEIDQLVEQLEDVCNQACEELQQELNQINETI